MLLTNSMQWRYEEEHRVTRVIAEATPEQQTKRAMGLVWNGQFVTVTDNALIGVTLGAAMDDDVALDLRAEIKERRPRVEVWRAVTAMRHYNLDFERIL
jgi:hypothetical protein